MLQQLRSVPESFLTCAATELHELFPTPTLIHLEGIKKRPVFISILLHGNETSGLTVVQRLLSRYKNRTLPRSLSIFLGNTEAARQGLRHLPEQPDYNRIWPGSDLEKSEHTEIAQDVFSNLAKLGPFASIDIHNNTGRNPHYCCITDRSHQHLQLARRFGRLVLYLNRLRGLQSGAFATLCPAVTLECGQPGELAGIERAELFIEEIMNLDTIEYTAVDLTEIDLFHNVAQAYINPEISFSFTDIDVDFVMPPTLDRLNFTEVDEGTPLGKINRDCPLPLIATDHQGKNVSHQYFKCQHDQLVLNRPVMPSMISLDEKVIVQDCLCYLMERISL